MDINKYIEEDEKVIYSGKGNPQKSNKQISRFIIAFITMIVLWLVFYFGIKISNINIRENIVFIVLVIIVLLLISISIIYAFLYNTLLNKKHKNDIYYITNKKVYIFNSIKDPIIESISNFDKAQISREKDNYGDLVFFKNTNTDDSILLLIFKLIRNDSNNHIDLIGIENPRELLQSILNINPEIYVFDDRPTILGKKV